MAGDFVIDTKAVKKLIGSPDGPVVKELLRRARNVQTDAKRRCPVDNGTLRASISTELRKRNGSYVVRIGSNLPYARYVHDGTGIYGPRGRPITPVRAKALRWAVRGTRSAGQSRVPGRGQLRSKSQTPTGWAYARSVKGMKPRPFLRDALPAAKR